MDIERVGDFTLGWGESLVWDDRRDRLYFVDCAARTLHWLDGGEGAPATLAAPSMIAGIVPTDDGRLVGALDDGLHLIDPDAGMFEPLAPYPDELGGRANDACADLDGNLITGTLNLGPADGSAWWYSAVHGWRVIDRAISNTNGPAVAVLDGTMTLVVGDSSAQYWAYDYDPATGEVGPRRVFGDVDDLDGVPDGSTLDAAWVASGARWSAAASSPASPPPAWTARWRCRCATPPTSPSAVRTSTGCTSCRWRATASSTARCWSSTASSRAGAPSRASAHEREQPAPGLQGRRRAGEAGGAHAEASPAPASPGPGARSRWR